LLNDAEFISIAVIHMVIPAVVLIIFLVLILSCVWKHRSTGEGKFAYRHSAMHESSGESQVELESLIAKRNSTREVWKQR